MASFKRTYDTDLLTIRKVFAYNNDSSVIQGQRVLTADGNGGTYWAIPETLGTIPAFNSIVLNNSNVINAIGASNCLSVATNAGLGLSYIGNTLYAYNKGFTTIDISGGNTLQGYSNFTETPSVKLVGRNGIQIQSNPDTNTVTFTGIPTEIASGVYAFNQIEVTSNAVNPIQKTTLTAEAPTTMLKMEGLGDIYFTANATTNKIQVGISTFTSSEYLGISTVVASLYGDTLSTASTFFVLQDTYAQGTSTLSTGIGVGLSNLSTSLSAKVNYDATYAMNNYLLKYDYRLTSTSIDTKLKSLELFKSTLKNTQVEGTLNGDYNSGSDSLLFSTSLFRLDSVSSMINNSVTVPVCRLTYSPNMILSANLSTSRIFSISTFLQVGETVLEGSIFERKWMANNASSSNIYMDTFTLPFEKSQVFSGLTSTFAIMHKITPYSIDSNGFQSLTLNNTTYPGNSLEVSIQGKTLF